ncbi:MAG: efflux RND transporter periplasmic adaptor subunit, partial [Verrucomicrobia bacterium]|nr:efflux RND transporter periplasmic adaptor subunit [Verrucomicrobiota bacterium]
QGLRDITTKYEGWIEKLHVNTTWTVVKAGDPLFEIYSPDLYNAQLNYALALRGEGVNGGPLTRTALARLQLFDVPADFTDELKRSGEARRTLVFRAPADGVVIEKMAVAGQMMKPGERIYRLADLSSVWVQAQIYEKDLPFLRTGQAAMIRTSYGPERKFDGTVQLLLPQVEEQTRTATARIVLPNPDGFLRPGMFVEVSFASQLADDAVLVPDMAVLRSGERNTVFLALDGGFFEPREVQLGARSEGGFYQVLGGLRAGERVVTSGQFMLDSESQLREAIQKMLRSPAGPQPAATAEPAAGGRERGAMKVGSGAPVAATAKKSEAAAAASLPENAVALLKPLALASADASAALAADDFAGYKKQWAALRSALVGFFSGYEHAAHGPLGKFKGGLADPADLAAARRDFEPFSSAIADLARENHLHHTEKLHVFECPMAPVTGKARWLQREAGTKNPFFGSKMSGCGDEIAGPQVGPKKQAATGADLPAARVATTAGLPSGHPPLGEMSSEEFARWHLGLPTSATVANAGGSCGSCGMSAAAMAAGEPCEHGK